MIKLLQKKFVMTAMMAISLLIFFLLGAINAVNIVIIREDIDRTLIMLTESRVEMNTPEMFSPSQFPDTSFYPQSNNNRLLFSPYFTVVADAEADMLFMDLTHISTIDEDDAKALVKKVLQQNQLEGKTDGYRYKVTDSVFIKGYVIAFLDTTNEFYSYLRILFLSLGVGFVCWVLMFFLVVMLSKKAIRPIAENMEKQKEFITNAGHEIKTPLAIIQANTEAMELYGGENKWSKNIKQQVSRLDGLMKNLLFLTRSDENALNAQKTDFSLSEVVNLSAESFVEPMKLKGIDFKVSVQDNISISADKEQITQLISILLDNAFKYTNDNGYINLTLFGRTLYVENTVSELPAVSPERLFDRFYRSNTARTQKTGGYGIGLSMAKAICDANKAVICVKYISENTIRFEVNF